MPRSSDPTLTEFGRQVRDALLRLHDVPYLQRHPLARLLAPEAGNEGIKRGHALQGLLQQAIEGLDVSAERVARRHDLMQARYVEALDVAQVCARLGISKTEYYREHRDGLAALVTILRPEEPSESEPAGRNPGWLVGRDEPLNLLKDAFHRASVGEGGLALVAGEPGIGKTAVCQELARWVLEHGGGVVTGHCYEHACLAMPYLPLIEALQTYLRDRPAASLREALGDMAPNVAAVLPAIGAALGVEPKRVEDPEARFRLFQSAVAFLQSASRDRPFLLLIEDLHDADSDSLNLLTYVVRNLQGVRLLIVATYRDVPIDRSRPIAAALPELRRGALFARVSLKGLREADVALLLARLTGRDQGALARGIYQQTEGNPLFVQEVLRHLTEEGHLGQGVEGVLAALPVPAGIREVIGSRLTRLSPACRLLMGHAAVLGQEFECDILAAFAGLDDEVLFAAVEEALDAGVIGEVRGAATPAYAFTHTLVRQALYDAFSLPRRQRLHLDAAAAIQKAAWDRPGASVALAWHYRLAGANADPDRVQQYSQAAAEAAATVFATAMAASARQDPA